VAQDQVQLAQENIARLEGQVEEMKAELKAEKERLREKDAALSQQEAEVYPAMDPERSR
jgi:predicted  nucleic acid-binding Zn-ribbon protein